MKKNQTSTFEKVFKMKHIMTAILCIMMTLCIFGCGPSKEEQYNTLKKETIKLSDEISEEGSKAYEKVEKIHLKYTKSTGKPYRNWSNEERAEKAQAYLEGHKKMIPLAKKVKENLVKMEELTKSSVQLTNDFNKTKEEIKYTVNHKIGGNIHGHNIVTGLFAKQGDKTPDGWEHFEEIK